MDRERQQLVESFMGRAKAQATRFAARCGWQGDKAKDAISVAYEASCVAGETYNPTSGPFEHYASVIVRNALYSMGLRESRTILAGEQDESEDRVPITWDSLEDGSPGPEELYEQAELEERLMETLPTLLPDEQEVLFALHGLGDYAEPLTTREAGEVLGVSEGTVRRLRDRALRKMEARI